MIREIVHIDEDLCDGCGLCVPSCAEGAIRVINGKARLVSDRMCDGMGACLGHCPKGAIRIERREADAFDESAVAAPAGHATAAAPAPAGGCPSARFVRLGAVAETGCDGTPVGESDAPSMLRQWPVQLRLLPASAPVLRGAHLLLAADCAAFAMGGFHGRLLKGRVLAIACPKLDDLTGYVEKLTEMLRLNRPASVTVARMEVPCCGGLLMMALEARRRSGVDVPVHDLVISTRGDVLGSREVPMESAA
ncbi:MAG: 4Fe-4S binding protein [Phycisphaerae bacterium]|nr:4Fe-4S binding protein [Phycisphaerae bacterium]